MLTGMLKRHEMGNFFEIFEKSVADMDDKVANGLDFCYNLQRSQKCCTLVVM